MTSVFFRADGNSMVGVGHIMRCLSIADAFDKSEVSVRFVLADENVKELVDKRGYDSVVMSTPFDDMDAELPVWDGLKAFYSSCMDMVIVDSYYVTDSYLRGLKDRLGSGRLLYLDDVASFPYPVDIIVNYNAYARRSIYESLYMDAPLPELVLGASYVPLRSMFRDNPHRQQSEVVRDILFSTGGGDELHIAKAVLGYLRDLLCFDGRAQFGAHEEKKCIYHFLIGSMNVDKEEIRVLAQAINAEYGEEIVNLHENVSDIKGLFSDMDIVVSAAGGTMYEVCSVGVPLITYITADNQIPGAEAFERNGWAVDVGDVRLSGTVDPSKVISGKLDGSVIEKIFDAIDELDDDFDRRCKMGERMQEAIDGYGADRMVKELRRLY